MATMTNEDFDKMMQALSQDEVGSTREFWKPRGKEEGEWVIRLLPPIFKKNEALPYFRHQVHYVNGKKFDCLNQTLIDKNGVLHKSERCPFCEMKEKLYRKGEKGSEEWFLAGKLKARNIYDYRGVVRTSDDPNKIRIIRIPIRVHEEIMQKLKSRRHGNIFDLQEGKDIILIKKGKNINTSYSMDLASVSPLFETSEEFKNFVKDVQKVDFSVVIEFSSFDDCKNELDIFLGNEENASDNKTDEVDNIIKTATQSDKSFDDSPIERNNKITQKEKTNNAAAGDDFSDDKNIDAELDDLFG